MLSIRSTRILMTCKRPLQLIAEAVAEFDDFTVLRGHVTREAHDELRAAEGVSVDFPGSPHNDYPSSAFDFAPYPETRRDFKELAERFKQEAKKIGVSIAWNPEKPDHIELITS